VSRRKVGEVVNKRVCLIGPIIEDLFTHECSFTPYSNVHFFAGKKDNMFFSNPTILTGREFFCSLGCLLSCQLQWIERMKTVKSNTIKRSSAADNRDNAISQDLLPKHNLLTFLYSRTLQMRRRKHRGIALVWVVIFTFLIILLVGLSLDAGKVCIVAHQLQNAADAAALAGGRIVKLDQSDARQRAIDIAHENYADGDPVLLDRNEGNLLDGDIVIGRYNRSTRTFVANTVTPNALKVVARRTEASLGGNVRLIFGPLVGVDTSSIERHAIAMATGGTGAGLIALSPSGVGLDVRGTVDLYVNDGAIQVNSEDDDALSVNGTPAIHANEVDVWGDVDATGGFEFPPEPEMYIDTDAPPIPDPLCPYWLPITSEPSPSDCIQPPSVPATDLSPSPGEALVITGGTHVLEPGYYSGGFRISGGDVTLKPGIYILDGSSSGQESGLVIGGNTIFCAKGVMFYIMGDGVVDMTGTGLIEIDPLVYDPNEGSDYFCDPSYSYPEGLDSDINYYDGMAIFQERGNNNEARIIGTGLMDLTGTLYFPTNHVELGGTGDGFGNQLIAWSAYVHGTGDITINYDGRNPGVANRAFLVE
jgi:Flp pilus assembly protein TadG